MENRDFETKIIYEVRRCFKNGWTMSAMVSFTNQEDAEQEARNLHQKDGKTYKVTKVTKQDVYRIDGE